MADLRQLIDQLGKDFGERRSKILSTCVEAALHKRPVDASLLGQIAFDFDLSSQFIGGFSISKAYNLTKEIETAYFLLTKARDQFANLIGGFYGAHMLRMSTDLLDSIVPILEAFFNFTSAAKVLLEAYRRFRKSYGLREDSYRVLLDKSFYDKGLASFILKARDVLHHEGLFHLAPSLSYSFGETDKFSAAIGVESDALLKYEWSSDAKAFIARSTAVDIVQAIWKYFDGAEAVFVQYKQVCGISSEYEYAEIKKIEAARATIGFITFINVVFQYTDNRRLQFLKRIKEEFGAREYKAIEALACTPEMAADYIFSVRDPFGIHKPADKEKLVDLIQASFC